MARQNANVRRQLRATDVSAGLEESYERLRVLSRQTLAPPFDGEPLDMLGACFRSEQVPHLNLALFVLGELLRKYGGDVLPRSFLNSLIDRIPSLLKHPSAVVVYQAIDYYAWLRSNYPDYREQMLGHLASADPGLRKRALRHYESYCRKGEIDPLLRFENDTYATDIQTGGPWVYELRDLALTTIENVTGQRFLTRSCTEPHFGSEVSWRDWAPFRRWYGLQKPSKAR